MGYLLVPWYQQVPTVPTVPTVPYLYTAYPLNASVGVVISQKLLLAIKNILLYDNEDTNRCGILVPRGAKHKKETHGLRSKPTPWIARR